MSSTAASPVDSSGRLEPCPKTPNCVSTQATRDRQRMAPIPFRGEAQAARDLLVEILGRLPRVRIAAVGERSVVAVFTTRLLFRDDVVLLVDAGERVIHFRSASRLGRTDFGANRARMEHLTELFLAAQGEAGAGS